jgi:hypothetical protein
MFEFLEQAFRQVVALNHQLDGAAAVLQADKGNFTHHALGHHAPGQGELLPGLGQLVSPHLVEPSMQLTAGRVFPEIIRKRLPFRPQRIQLDASFRNQAVFVDFCFRRFGFFVHVNL